MWTPEGRLSSTLLLAAVVVLGTGPGCRSIPARPLPLEDMASALRTRSLDDPGLRDLLVRSRTVPPRRWPPPEWGLEELTLAAIYFQPTLTVARADASIGRAQVVTAAQRPNPTLWLTPQLVSNPAAGVSPWIATNSLRWPIETAGKQPKRVRTAEANAAAAEARVWTEVWAVRSRIYAAVVSLAAAEARERTLAETKTAQAALTTLFERQLAAGAVSRAELEPQEIALVHVETQVASAERRVLETRAALATALAVPPAAVDRTAVAFALDRAPTGLAELDPGAAREAALLGRSDIRSLLFEYASTEADLQLQLARQYPDVILAPGYEFDQGSNKWGFTVALDLPVMNRNEGPIAEALARRRQTAARVEALQATIIAEVGAAWAQLEGARGEWRQVQRLVDHASRQRRLAEEALARGAADRVAVLSAEIQSLTAAATLVDAQEAFQLAAAALELAVQPSRPFLAEVDASALSIETEDDSA